MFWEKLTGREERIPEEESYERKTGIRRVLEIINRDAGKLMLCGWLACLGLVPYVLGLSFAVKRNLWWLVIVSGILGGMAAAPQLNAMIDRVLRCLRDEPEDWWGNYRRVWKRDFGVSLLPGAITGLLVGAQIYVACQIGKGVQASSLALALVCLEVDGILLWMWVQISLLSEGLGVILKNAAMLSILHFGRTLLASAMCLVYAAIVWLSWPFSQIPFLFTQVWVPGLLACFMLYKPCNEVFRIEERLQEQSKTT